MQSVCVRLVLYILSTFFGLSAAWLAGWGVAWAGDSQSLTSHLPTLVAAVFGAAGASWPIFARWGVR